MLQPSRPSVHTPPSLVTRALRNLMTKLILWFYIKPFRGIHKTTTYSGLRLQLTDTVFHPSFYFSSRYFASVLERSVDFSGKRVLDIGCGSGILSLVAARAGASVVAVDVNPDAVECTRQNAKINLLHDRITAFQSDLFSSLPPSERFDYIITNPPFFVGVPASLADSAWRSPVENPFMREVASQARHYLKSGGSVYCVFSSDADFDGLIALFHDHGYTHSVLASRRFYFEQMYVLQFSCLSPVH